MKKIWKATAENVTLREGIGAVCVFATLFTAYALVYVVAPIVADDLLLAVKMLAILAVPFVILSVLRRILNFPRPYDVYPELFGDTAKRRSGRSFPSRHVFSAFAIGTLLIPYSLAFGISVLVSGVVIALCRIFVGLHFVKDVLAGAAVGVIGSVLGLLLIL